MESYFVQRHYFWPLFFSSLLFSFTFPLWPPIPAELSCPQLPCTIHLNLSSALSLILFLFLGRRTLYWTLSMCWALCFIYIDNIKRKVFVVVVVVCLFYRWGKWDSGKLCDLPKFTHLLRHEAGAKLPFLKPICWPLHFSHLVQTALETKILLLLPREILI